MVHSQYSQTSQLLPGVEHFRRVLSDVGVTFRSDPDMIINLTKEQALVVKELSAHFDTKQNCDKDFASRFSSGLKYLCKKEKYFKKFLVPTQFEKLVENEKSVYYQDSLLSIFLKVPHLQDVVIDLLLESVTEISLDEMEDTSWLRSLLKPLRCLPLLKNGDKLAKKMLDILEISSFACQLEILEAIPEIIPDNQCDFAAKQLTKLLDENEELCGAIVDCLTALNLESDLRSQINDKILARILAGVSLKVYLILIKFLLTDLKPTNVLPTLLKIRNSLDNMMRSIGKDKESDKTMIFCFLQTSTLAQKVVAEGWLSSISTLKAHKNHKPIDLLIMFMLHHTSEIRKRIIESTFRKRVSLGLFKINLLEKLFEKYMTQQLLKDYMSDIVKIGCYLLRFARDEVVAKFGTRLFQSLFNHDYTPAIYRGEILSNLISLIGSTDQFTINTVLKLIFSLVITDSQKLLIHIPLLMQLLEKLDSLDFKDVKIVFDILCFLLCGDRAEDSLSGYRNQIFNTIRKQLSCSERTVKHRGIISAIVMVKHTVSTDRQQADVSISEGSVPVSSLRGSSKEAAELLELVSCATGDNPDLLCLYYDQLASILASVRPFEKHFLYWLYRKVEDDFEAIYLTSTVPKSHNDINFSIQYILNSPQEIETVFAINIAGYTVCDKNDKILLLAPYFRVLRLLHFRQHRHLSEIDSLLGCGVVLPQINDPDDLEAPQIAQVVDCLFHCINWFREVVNAFVNQKDALLQKRVVKRLDDLIGLEKKLFLFLKQVPSHNLPLSYFYSVEHISKQLLVKNENRPAKNPKKKIKSSSVVENNETCTLTVNTQDATKTTSSNLKKSLSNSNSSVQFREMDIDIIRLIKYPLKFEQEPGDKAISLNIQQVKFILSDFIIKLSVLTRHKETNLSRLNDVNPDHLVQDCVRIVRNLNKFFDIIVNNINHILEEPEDTYYTDEVNDLKNCFGHILQIYYLIFQWPGFQDTGNMELLKDILESANNVNSHSQNSLTSVNKLVIDFVAKISECAKNCLHLSHAANLIKIIDTLHGLTVPSSDMKTSLSSIAEKFLSRKWYDLMGRLDVGQSCNQNIDVIVKMHLRHCKVEAISGIINSLVEDVAALEPKAGCLTKYPSINPKNFHIFYIDLWNALLDAVKVEIQSLTNMGHLTLWLNVAVAVANLKTIAQTAENRNNLSTCLKKTTAILKTFLSHGIPMMEIMIKTHSAEVYNVMKTIQVTTRFLHKLCCQSKSTRDAAIVAHIPAFKQTLESIIYRVKAALVVNNCSSAFWFGNLKNQNTHQEDIVSQSTVISSSEPELNNSEHLPSDDEDADMDINESSSDNIMESVVM